MSEPHSATPILTPTCLLVEVTAEAAPARSCGIPLTAALVTGAFTIAKPMPNTPKITRTAAIGVTPVSRVSIAVGGGEQQTGDQQGGRAPNLVLTIRPDSGEKTSAPIAIGR